MKSIATALAGFLLAMGPLGAAQAAAEPMEAGAAEEVNVLTTVATVEDIDVDQRQITLKTPDGKTVLFDAGPEVRNFDRVRKGDRVVVDYFDGFAIALGPKGAGVARVDSIEVARAKKGDKPGLAVTKTIEVEARVKAVDKKHRVVSLEGALKTLVLRVGDTVDLSKVKAGDTVYAVYSETYLIAVLPPADASGEVQIESTSIALGIGVTWGHGSLSLKDGTKRKFKIDGLSLVDLGISSVKAGGYVYGLKDIGDFGGTYYGGKAGITMGGGGGNAVLKNSKGVTIYLDSRQAGLQFSLAGGGAKITLVD